MPGTVRFGTAESSRRPHPTLPTIAVPLSPSNHWMAFLPLVALGLGILFLRAYKLTERSVNETRKTLEERRGVLQEQN